MAEVVDCLLDEIGQISIVLKIFRKFDIMDERGTYRAIDLWRELIAILEALSESLNLIATAGQTDNVFSTVVLEIEHKSFLSVVECYTHSLSVFGMTRQR